MSKTESVQTLIKKYCWHTSPDSSLSTGKNSVLPEEAWNFLSEYAGQLNVDMSDFDFRRDFPHQGIKFYARITMRQNHFTVGMLITSAKAGRRFYPE